MNAYVTTADMHRLCRTSLFYNKLPFLVVASSEHVNCMLGADGTNDALASCLQKGDDFLRAYYTKRVKGGKDDFETCG